MPIREPLFGLRTFGYFATAAILLVLATFLLRLVAHDAVATCAKSFVSAYPHREENPDALGTAWVSHSRRWWITEVLPPTLVLVALLRAYCLEHSARTKAAAAASPARTAASARVTRMRRLFLLMFIGVTAGWLLFPVVYDTTLKPAKMASKDYECALGTFGRGYTPGMQKNGTASAIETDSVVEAVPNTESSGESAAVSTAVATTTDPMRARARVPSQSGVGVTPRPNGVSGHAFYYCWILLWGWYAGSLAVAARATARASTPDLAAAASGDGDDIKGEDHAVELETDSEAEADELEFGADTETGAAIGAGADPEAGMGSQLAQGHGQEQGQEGMQEAQPLLGSRARHAAHSSSSSSSSSSVVSASSEPCHPSPSSHSGLLAAVGLTSVVLALLSVARSPRVVTRIFPVLAALLCGWSFVITLTYAYHTLQQVLLGTAAAAVIAPLPLWAAEWARVRAWPPLRKAKQVHLKQQQH